MNFLGAQLKDKALERFTSLQGKSQVRFFSAVMVK